MKVLGINSVRDAEAFITAAEILMELGNDQVNEALMHAQKLQEDTEEHIDKITIKFIPIETTAKFTQNVEMVIKEK